MKKLRGCIPAITMGLLFYSVLLACAQDMSTHRREQVWDFEEVSTGRLPVGWKVEATNRNGLLATWRVIEDKTAPSGRKTLALSSINHKSDSTFNLCWTNDILFLDGEVEVHLKAIKGEVDQGGGIIWRALDKDNYYITRFNPLEDNFRIYYVRDGSRKMLASAQIKLPSGKWHILKIVQNGAHILGYINGKKLLDIEDDTFARAGGVGLWTKADAVTSFDDFIVRNQYAVK